jgi:hypothetical protein
MTGRKTEINQKMSFEVTPLSFDLPRLSLDHPRLSLRSRIYKGFRAAPSHSTLVGHVNRRRNQSRMQIESSFALRPLRGQKRGFAA